jgi:hypothetical protein
VLTARDQTWEAWTDANAIAEDQRNLARTMVDRATGRLRIFLYRVPEPRWPRTACIWTSRWPGLSGDERRALAEPSAKEHVRPVEKERWIQI